MRTGLTGDVEQVESVMLMRGCGLGEADLSAAGGRGVTGGAWPEQSRRGGGADCDTS